MTGQAMTTQGNAEVLDLIDQVASHGEALALTLIDDDHGKGVDWKYMAAILDDLKHKFQTIRNETSKIHVDWS